MKTLREIIEAVKDGKKPEYDELRYALLALSFLHSLDSQYILKVYQKSTDDKPFGLKFLAEESFNRSKRAYAIPPKEYVGDNWNPDNPDYQKQRQRYKKLIDMILDED